MCRTDPAAGSIMSLIFIAAASTMMLPYLDGSAAHAYEDTRITVDFPGGDTLHLENNERVMQIGVIIENYNPSDGHYFMTVTHDGEIVKETNLLVEDYRNDLWKSSAAYTVFGQSAEPAGEYKVLVYTELGGEVGTATFYVDSPASPAGHQQEEEGERTYLFNQFLESTEPVTDMVGSYADTAQDIAIVHLQNAFDTYVSFLEIMFETESQRSGFTVILIIIIMISFPIILIKIILLVYRRIKRYGKVGGGGGHIPYPVQVYYPPQNYPQYSGYHRTPYKPAREQNTNPQRTHYEQSSSQGTPNKEPHGTHSLDTVYGKRIMVDANVLIDFVARRKGREFPQLCRSATFKFMEEHLNMVDIPPEVWKEYKYPEPATAKTEEDRDLYDHVLEKMAKDDDKNLKLLNDMYSYLISDYNSSEAGEWLRMKAGDVWDILSKKGHNDLPLKEKRDERHLADIPHLNVELRKEALQGLFVKAKNDMRIIAYAMRKAENERVILLTGDGDIILFSDEINEITGGRLHIIHPDVFEERITR